MIISPLHRTSISLLGVPEHNTQEPRHRTIRLIKSELLRSRNIGTKDLVFFKKRYTGRW
jgi:hypothetical protein